MALLGSKAFRRGFLDGLSSPYRFLSRSGYTRPASNLVATSWQAVGRSMYSVMSDGSLPNVKTTGYPSVREIGTDKLRH